MTQKVIILFLFISVFIIADTSQCFEQKQITVIFRYDDYSTRSPTDMELKLVNAFRKLNFPCTFGVIPYVAVGDTEDTSPQDVAPLSHEKANILREGIKGNIIEVALHGYSHQNRRKGADGLYTKYTEFSGLEYEQQLQRITKGKNLLEELLGVRVTLFIPPYNTYDFNTLRALGKTGFEIISAGRISRTRKSPKLKFLPQTSNLINLPDAIGLAKKISDDMPIIVVLFHKYDFIEIDKAKGKMTYQEFYRLLNWVALQKDVHVRSMDETSKIITDLDFDRFMNYTELFSSSTRQLIKLLPPFTLNSLYIKKPYFYPSLNTSKWMINKSWLILLLFYLFTLMTSITIAALAEYFLFSRLKIPENLVRYGSLVVLGLFSIYTLHDLDIYYRGARILICLFGICIGIWWGYYKSKKRNRRASSVVCKVDLHGSCLSED